MLNETSLRNSPSILKDPTASRIAPISSSFNSFTFLSPSTPAFSSISFARLLPIPKIYVNAITPLYCLGISTPAIRAITYPCLCLNLGFFLLITYKRPFLRTILQSALLFLTDALTFILVSVCDSSLR
jgi:hypothetical protein